ncbi:unnamed protein product [Linum trigynum]|uniref:Uncharacterized protein n=1 Tax=Linum trigynum TaxID=586398 RepID=A0AAV2GLR2_9ROSI
MKADFLRDNNMGPCTSSKKTMDKLRKSDDADKNDKSVMDLVLLLFDTTLPTSMFSVEGTLATRIHRMLLELSTDEDDLVGGDESEMPSLEDDGVVEIPDGFETDQNLQ